MSFVVVRELLRPGLTRTIEKADGVDVDANDAESCLTLLKRTAKRNGVNPTDCDIIVKTGQTTRTYRTG